LTTPLVEPVAIKFLVQYFKMMQSPSSKGTSTQTTNPRWVDSGRFTYLSKQRFLIEVHLAQLAVVTADVDLLLLVRLRHEHALHVVQVRSSERCNRTNRRNVDERWLPMIEYIQTLSCVQRQRIRGENQWTFGERENTAHVRCRRNAKAGVFAKVTAVERSHATLRREREWIRRRRAHAVPHWCLPRAVPERCRIPWP
jgi:hypothetical protein